MLYSPNVMAISKCSLDPHPPLSNFGVLTEGMLRKWQRLISRMNKVKEAIKRIKRMALMAQK